MAETTALTRAYFEEYPAEVTEAIERMTPAEAAAIIEALPSRVCAPVFEALSPASGAELLTALPPDKRASIIARIPVPLGARFVRRLSDATRARLIDDLPAATVTALRRALGYTEGTAGALMNVEVPTLTVGATVADARETARRMTRHLGNQLYVVDREGRLAGRVDMAELLRRPDTVPIETLMVRRVEVVTDRTVLAQAAESPGWSHTRYLPVVDGGGRFLGVLANTDLRAAVRRRPAAHRDVALSGAPLELCALYVLGMVRLLEAMSEPAAAEHEDAGRSVGT